MLEIRKANPRDTKQIGIIIGKCMGKEYKYISKHQLKLGAALISGIDPSNFYVAILNNFQMVGILGITKKNKGAVTPKKSSFIASFGVIPGLIKCHRYTKLLSHKHITLDDDSCFIEIACVLKEHRRRGVFKRMLEHAYDDLDYLNYYAESRKSYTDYITVLQRFLFRKISETRKSCVFLRTRHRF